MHEENMENGLLINDIFFSYSNGKNIFHGFSYEFYKNKIYGIMGRNGVGKTTLGKLIVRLLQIDQGEILLNGRNIQKMSLGEIGKVVGYVYQNPEKQLFASTVYEELSFILDLKNIPNKEQLVEEQLKKFDLYHLKDRFPFFLSQGEKQRLVLAGILLEHPDFLILDEPTTSLDCKRKEELGAILTSLQKEQGIGILIISHDRKFLEALSCEEVYLEREN